MTYRVEHRSGDHYVQAAWYASTKDELAQVWAQAKSLAPYYRSIYVYPVGAK